MHKGSWQESRDLWVGGQGRRRKNWSEKMWTTGKFCLGEQVRGSSESLSGLGLSAKDVSGWVSSLLSDTMKRWTKEFWEKKNKEKVAGYKCLLAHRPWSIQFCYTEQRYSSVMLLLIISESHLFLSFPFSSSEQTVTSWTRVCLLD